MLAETSTGAWQPMAEIADLVHDAGAMLLVDAVTALGGVPVAVDDWQIDAVYAGSQKCLSCPPGLAPVSFNPRAVEVILNRKTKVQSWYLDVTMLSAYWGQDRVYHHTAPVNMTYALHEALRLILAEGLETCFARHLLNHPALKAGLTALGIQYSAQEGHQLPMLNAVHVPPEVDDAWTRRQLLERFGIEIGAGLGAFKGRVWRIGLMGYAARPANVLLLLSALEQLLGQQGAVSSRAPVLPPPTRSTSRQSWRKPRPVAVRKGQSEVRSRSEHTEPSVSFLTGAGRQRLPERQMDFVGVELNRTVRQCSDDALTMGAAGRSPGFGRGRTLQLELAHKTMDDREQSLVSQALIRSGIGELGPYLCV